MRKQFLTCMLAIILGGGLPLDAYARDTIRIVGSSTVYPFSTVVAEKFGRKGPFKTPIVEATGSGGGFKLFCAGVGPDHPDITNASRRIKEIEIKDCVSNGVKEIIEVRVGYDGIVMARSKAAPLFSLTYEQMFLALAKEIPMKGRWVKNPHTKWSEVDPSLPDTAIEVLGPPPTSGTRDAFVELVMDVGCEKFDEIRLLEKEGRNVENVCRSVREDGAYIDAGENDNLIVQKLMANPNALGVFGYSFLEENGDKIQGILFNDQKPTFENIASGAYPVSRSLQFYVKKAHVGSIPGMEAFLKEFVSEKAIGPEGYLTDKGLIPLPNREREHWSSIVFSLNPLDIGGL